MTKTSAIDNIPILEATSYARLIERVMNDQMLIGVSMKSGAKFGGSDSIVLHQSEAENPYTFKEINLIRRAVRALDAVATMRANRKRG